ncbi:hypothetical protein [Myxococcus landrumensis]|uniref:Lipoprotein MlpA n=1 Tax=Myxococcus landrumensis TaxID=2813577 RepID=A0ABX7NK86_9BACT|nr:hypothetical protein [Myxococcus landrumus]QSQ17980.1 hypothetical protein JY572_19000 [Myxococcus landrumus]
MTKNILNAALVFVGAASVLTGCNFDQPEAPCFVQDHVSWVARYDPVDDPKQADGSACTNVNGQKAPVAELVGVFKFTDPDNLGKSLLTIRPAGLANRGTQDPSPPSQQTASGAFATEPDANDFCAAPTMSQASVNTPTSGSTAGTSITYEYKNMEVYAAAATPGTQMRGELKYTRDNCVSTYAVRALWPALACDPTSATACGPGTTGLNPDFAAECLQVGLNAQGRPTGYCVPAKAIPSLR